MHSLSYPEAACSRHADALGGARGIYVSKMAGIDSIQFFTEKIFSLFFFVVKPTKNDNVAFLSYF